MSKVPPIQPDEGTSDMSPTTSTITSSSKPQRVLACLRCQQRKIKCDRRYPCSTCVKSRVQCIPATQLPRQRRRRFPERELLDRLRKYEDLLRQHNIKFEPLHKESPHTEGHNDSDDEQPKATTNVPSPSTTNSGKVYEAMNLWHAMSQEFREPDNISDSDDDDVREADVKKVWDQISDNDNFLFGSRVSNVDISTFHPEPVQIFRLWQIYLENINPLLKVTHTPSLQAQIIEAAGDLRNIKPQLEALMFGIYCVAISSLSYEDCQLMFYASKPDLLTRYQFGCQQGLLNSGFLRNRDDRDTLTALFFYLMSFRTKSVPQSLSSLLAIAVRIAQRMDCHNEFALSKLNPLEAEMRRRLWWSLVLYDTRIGEIADSKHVVLTPTWSCKVPLNASDSDFHIKMKDPPQCQPKPTEAIFVVLRGEMGNFIRNTTFHLDFNNPALKPAAKHPQHDPTTEGSELTDLEKMVEEKYLRFCDPKNPLHFTTIWTTRMSLAKWHLVEHWHFSGKTHSSKVGLVRDATIAHALKMLECDTKLMTSPLAKGFMWMSNMHFPFPAYFQIVQNFKRRPLSQQAERAWEVMTANYEARFNSTLYDEIPGPFFVIFAKIILQAWEVRELAFRSMGEEIAEPGIVGSVRQRMAELAGMGEVRTEKNGGEVDGHAYGDGVDFSRVPSLAFYGLGEDLGSSASGTASSGLGTYIDTPGMGLIDADISTLDWSVMDWGAVDVNISAEEGGLFF
ncbi:hypothetical protein BELL_0643g00050 [Botrytis elliptica]|uniref:Zn(2)-C6 fungal-type domain-containing protein n=1 Tax=Botrytis elliptica TaxID=278938 RepID=A0A4Z1JB44_9HELO|nr:hypothetical protein EAE99_004885 [Botrytis elliptica]TGO70941.1 hypothetical protein BELL_0643g00050 [Botrytis elliptica]